MPRSASPSGICQQLARDLRAQRIPSIAGSVLGAGGGVLSGAGTAQLVSAITNAAKRCEAAAEAMTRLADDAARDPGASRDEAKALKDAAKELRQHTNTIKAAATTSVILSSAMGVATLEQVASQVERLGRSLG